MNPHRISQISVPRRAVILPLIFAVTVLALGFLGCGEKTQIAKPGKIDAQSPDNLVENSKPSKLSSSAPVVDKQAAPTIQKIEAPKTGPESELAKQWLTQDDTAHGTQQQAAASQAPKTDDALVERESIAGTGKTATAPMSGDSKQNSDPDFGEEEGLSDSDEQDEQARPQFEIAEEQTIEFPHTWKRLGQNEIWIDMKNKQVILAGYICINVGALEMFACPSGTKEHESVVAVNALASEMHAALLAIGAKPGAPCSWDDVSFTTASGSRINIDVRWRDEKTKEVITRPAKEMMKVEGEKKLDIEWVFGGSRFREDFETNFRSYSANSGEMICVSNFSTAAIDVNIDSTDANGSWLFWANTDNVPPRGTRVYLILSPNEYFNAQRQVFAEAETQPAPIANKEEIKEPAAGQLEKKETIPQNIEPTETQSEAPKTKENSSDKGQVKMDSDSTKDG